MRIAQIVASGASEYERKSQRTDFAALSADHEVRVYDDPGDAEGDIAHLYGAAKRVRIAHVIDTELDLPEAVEEPYWPADNGQRATANVLGTFARRALTNIVHQTFARLHRTRDDIEWRLFERRPSPEEIAGVALWIDPALDDADRDGFVAEALVGGRVVVASRTAANLHRLEKGRTGLLVPPNDPNELTHAILAALFKPELGEARRSAARQTISKFRARHRLRALIPIYQSHLR